MRFHFSPLSSSKLSTLVSTGLGPHIQLKPAQEAEPFCLFKPTCWAPYLKESLFSELCFKPIYTYFVGSPITKPKSKTTPRRRRLLFDPRGCHRSEARSTKEWAFGRLLAKGRRHRLPFPLHLSATDRHRDAWLATRSSWDVRPVRCKIHGGRLAGIRMVHLRMNQSGPGQKTGSCTLQRVICKEEGLYPPNKSINKEPDRGHL